MQLPKRPAPGVSAAGQGQSNSLRWGLETEAGCSFLLCMAPSWALQPHLCCIRLNDKGCPSCSKWGVGKLKSYIQTRTCAVNNNVEQERHTPWDTVIQNASSDVPSCWREARDASRLATITWWSRLQLCQPGKLFCTAQLFLLCWKEIPPLSHSGFHSMPSCWCLRAADSCQLKPRRKHLVPNCSDSNCHCSPRE